MKAKKINLEPYEIELRNQEGNIVKFPYDVKTSIADIILSQPLKLNGVKLLRNQEIASKIINCKEKFILLEFNEYLVIKEATDILDVFSKNDVELVKRILNAEEVEVDEKNKI